MNVKVTRKGDSQTFTGVKSLTVVRKGFILHYVHVDVNFGDGASTHYIGKKHDTRWEINPDETPSMGMDFCEKIEIHSSGGTEA